ncbi:DNA polymerase III subunit beta [Pullulanibacillus sp. KACC 23026]|uniref:DNA polymerase III subunit beta n=1 Tax=Pullulanibacillus sp. KACC 23026 TaxID=3028315 RepID=UPI0023AFDF70|nr:DNA polymerase III subunit beta [Pullulanibacillus sp. KACC 23026]WEG15059.1 DNA polymerase III subunit beta [Pullulanibacillus sp. KACC 23026]
MKFTIDREKLVENVNHVMKAISSRTTISILTGIKISASPDGITLTGSDSDISIKAFIPVEENDQWIAQIDKPGSIVLQARFFNDIVKKLPGETVQIEVDHRFISRITSGTSEFNLNGVDSEEYPRLPVLEENQTVKIRTALLKHLIRQTVFAVSTSETRPVLTGVNWTIENNQLNCIATDSHRLAKRRISAEMSEGLAYQNVVIPGKSLNELSKIIDDNSEEWIEVVITESQILFKSENLLFYSRLLDGNFPDTDRVIPNESKTTIVVPTKRLLRAIDRASLLAREEKDNVVKLRTYDQNKIEILSQSSEIGRVFENIEANEIQGEELKISFSAKYMLEALNRIDSELIEIQFTGAMRPFVIRPTEDDGILMLILPVRTN